MVFNSLHFAVFFLIVLTAYRLLPHRGQNWLLLVASYYFYAAWDWRFLGLLIASTLIDFVCALAIARAADPRRRKLLLTLSLGFNLSMLGFFKYFNSSPTRCMACSRWRAGSSISSR
jgi:alginate O-acetyltransferase complex protein AlgI